MRTPRPMEQQIATFTTTPHRDGDGSSSLAQLSISREEGGTYALGVDLLAVPCRGRRWKGNTGKRGTRMVLNGIVAVGRSEKDSQPAAKKPGEASGRICCITELERPQMDIISHSNINLSMLLEKGWFSPVPIGEGLRLRFSLRRDNVRRNQKIVHRQSPAEQR